MGILVFPSGFQFSDSEGLPWALAQAYFYLAGTTTPSEVWEDADLSATRGVVVTADAKGLFPACFADTEVPLRVKIIQAGGDVDDPEIDIDNMSNVFEITSATQIADGVIQAKLGYTPVNAAEGAIFLDQVRLNYSPTEIAVDEAGFRIQPQNIQNGNYTFVLNDVGRTIRKDDTGTYNWTIPANASVPAPVGSQIYLMNGNTTALNILRDSGVSLILANDPTFTNQNMTLAPGEWGKLYKFGTNSWGLLKFNVIPVLTLSALPTGVAGARVYVTDLGGGPGVLAWDATNSRWYRERTEGYGVNAADAGATWTPLVSPPFVRYTATLTAARTINLSTTNAYVGMTCRHTRTGGDTLGPWNLSIGGLKNLVQNSWCDVTFDGSAWYLSAYGTL